LAAARNARTFIWWHELCSIVHDYLGSTDELRQSFPNCAVAQGESSERLVRYVKDRPGHDRHYAIDCAKIERECAFRPRISLEDGLHRTVSPTCKIDFDLIGDANCERYDH
jgi:dTDP-D-glucose 4,6-dehydratase